MGEIGIKQILKQRVSFRRISVTMGNAYQLLNMYKELYVTVTPPQKVQEKYF